MKRIHWGAFFSKIPFTQPRIQLIAGGIVLALVGFFAAEPTVQYVLNLMAGCQSIHAHPLLDEPATQDSLHTDKSYHCYPEKRCTEMVSCKEAWFHYHTCQHRWHDGNRNQIPCENLCARNRILP